jgi:hypothetical protein
MPQTAVELQRAGMKCGLEPGDELAAEHAAEHLDREEEAAGRADPSGVVRREPVGSQNTVTMRMIVQSLIPGVQDTEEADLRPQMTRIAQTTSRWFFRKVAHRFAVSGLLGAFRIQRSDLTPSSVQFEMRFGHA